MAENAGIMVVVSIAIVVWLMVFLVALKNMDKPPKKPVEDGKDEKSPDKNALANV